MIDWEMKMQFFFKKTDSSMHLYVIFHLYEKQKTLKKDNNEKKHTCKRGDYKKMTLGTLSITKKKESEKSVRRGQ